ncbi:MAG: tetrahydromethanopterin S-methyltransferase subunit A [Spirochaetes bacterium]|nr:tetrahydromethanopterin S-methyltransferase subunit A [Spirochaetota bacterium]
MLKVKPHPDYPCEPGRYIRGNDFSPAAVVIILNTDEDKIPPEIEALVRAGAETGAALSGTVQTPNIGFEKMICNIVANPNIRYIVLGGPESDGHQTGSALKSLLANGIDEKKKIIGTEAMHACLYNIPMEFIERFRKQIALIDLQFQGDPNLIRKAVWSCFQETPVDFMGHDVHDPGAYPEEPLAGKLTWQVTQPWSVPCDKGEQDAVNKAKELMERLRKRNTNE